MQRLCRHISDSYRVGMVFAAALGIATVIASGTATAQNYVESGRVVSTSFDDESMMITEYFGSEQSFDDNQSCDDCCSSGCRKRRRGVCGDLRSRRREANWFSCSCNGSYKFPVPPLYTYHWPGLYQLERMTDYHSPWRFPPLKPYAPEPSLDDEAFRPSVIRTSAVEPFPEAPSVHERRVAGGRLGPEPLSAKLRRTYGIAR